MNPARHVHAALDRFARRYLFADAAPLSPHERWRSAIAALLGVLIFEGVLFVLPVSADARRLLAPLGASSVILFALPHSPLAQPWSVIGGLLLPALVGFACGRWIPADYLAVGLAVAISVWLMAWLRCLHPPGARALARGPASVHFDHVGFAYEPSRQILHDVDFAIPAGKTVAVVGHSGSGKSTLARLLFRFYDVQGGAVRINGQDIRGLTQDSLRAAIGIVPQDTVLFNDTLFYNIQYGRPEASRAEVEAAARAAQLEDFIARLPDGWQTRVGERGLKLSGGEKQRVAIARTLLKNPDILIFDEATSALDSKTEKAIQAQLDAAARGRTTLVIAHRLSTVMNADEIIVLDQGRILERGGHAELLAKGTGLRPDVETPAGRTGSGGRGRLTTRVASAGGRAYCVNGKADFRNTPNGRQKLMQQDGRKRFPGTRRGRHCEQWARFEFREALVSMQIRGGPCKPFMACLPTLSRKIWPRPKSAAAAAFLHPSLQSHWITTPARLRQQPMARVHRATYSTKWPQSPMFWCASKRPAATRASRRSSLPTGISRMPPTTEMNATRS
jgi:ABC-type multidrug transport system ATPase subunit